jgi:CHAD domain-containing protein
LKATYRKPLTRSLSGLESAGSIGHRRLNSENINSGRSKFMALDRSRLLKPVERLQTLLKKLDREPAPGRVHDLRTNVRRFEAIFKALSLDQHGIHASTLKDLGRLHKRAGKVRDMDVLIRYGSTVHPKGEEESAVQLLEHLGNQRRKHARKLYAEARRLGGPLRKDLKRSGSVLAKLTLGPAADATSTAGPLQGELAAPGRLGKANLHAFRLKVKELRNVLDMEETSSRSRLAGALARVKDAIGEWHDWETLAAIAEKVLDRSDARSLIAELKRIARNKYREAMLLAEALRKTVRRQAG